MKTKCCGFSHASTAILLLLIMYCPIQLFAQLKTVRGNVTNDQGESLSNVSVMVKGKSEGTTTDQAGNFSIDLSSHGTTLVFSYVGYQSQEIILLTVPVI
jgi:hypothetical protein